jgi:hypothetical protein
VYADSNAFISPQWGGVVILDNTHSQPNSSTLTAPDLAQSFRLFASQLHTLLGVPTLPSFFKASSPETLLTWQVDTLVKRRTIENVKESVDTLGAITKLAKEIQNMRVGSEVRRDVVDALHELDQVRSVGAVRYVGCLRAACSTCLVSIRWHRRRGLKRRYATLRKPSSCPREPSSTPRWSLSSTFPMNTNTPCTLHCLDRFRSRYS